MQLYRFDAGVGRVIERFGSVGVRMTPIARPVGDVRVGCFHLAPGGRIGHHPATVPQLLLVVSGAGWVRGGGDGPAVRTPIAAGQAAFWQTGEEHETGSDAGLMAIVLEADTLDPAQLLTPLPGAPTRSADEPHA